MADQNTNTPDPTACITLENNVLKDAKFETLRAEGFVRGPTVRSQWVAIVNEAWANSRIPRTPEVQPYLVLMLERMTTDVSLDSLALGLTYYSHAVTSAVVAEAQAQYMADVALLFVSLFPERQAYRHHTLSVEHLVGIGQELYHRLWRNHPDEPYGLLAEQFMRYVFVLRHVRPAVRKCMHSQFDHALRIPTQYEARDMLHSLERSRLLLFPDQQATRTQ